MLSQVARSCPLRISNNSLRCSLIVLLSTGAILFLSSYLLSFAHSGQSEPTPLSLNVPIERELKGVETYRFGVVMHAGAYARINVQRKGIDVLVNVSSPDGTNSWQYENPAGPESPMSLSILATAAGLYTIEVQPIEKWVADGRYEIRLAELRPSGPQDEKRLEAERKVVEGRSKQLLDTSESRRAARDLYQEALMLWRELGDGVEEANTLHFIAQTFRGSGKADLDLCIGNYRQALERRGEADKQATAYTVLDMAGAYSDVDEFAAAISQYTQALHLFEAVGNRRGQAAALYGRGLTNDRWQKMTQALKDYEPALRIYTNPETRDRHEEARTLHAMGGAYDVLGDPRAQTYFERALEGWRETKDPGQEGNTYSSLAKLEMDRGDWQKAFEAYDQAFELYKLGEAISIREKPAIRRRRASSLYGVAYTYAALGDYPKAFELLKQSLELRQPGKKSNTYMLTGYFQVLSGKPEEALETCAMGIADQQDNPRIGETYTTMGAAYSMLGKHKEALELYDKALAIQTNPNTSYPEAEAITQGWRGESLVALGEPEKALASYERARELWQKKEPNGVAVALIGMARAERARNNLSKALDYVTKAIAIIEPLRTHVTSEDLRTNYFSTKVDYYELYIDLSMRLAESSSNAQLTAAAFEASERARARSLIETLAKARFEGGVRSDRELADLVSSYRHIQEEIKRPKDQSNVAELRTKQAQIELRLRAQYPRYAALMFPQPLKPVEVQKLLDPDTLLLEFSLGEERSYVWAVTATELHAYKLPPRSEIERTAKRLVAHLKACERLPGEPSVQHVARMTNELNEYWPEATAFSHTLLGQISELSLKKHLVIVADGELQYLPFAALPAPDGASGNADNGLNSVLIKDHEITNLPSASVLSILRQTTGRKPPTKLLAVFADPVLERDDPRIKLASHRKPPNPATPPGNELAQALRDVDSLAVLDQLPRLQASGREAREIVDLAGRPSSLEQLGFAANRKNATSKELSQYRIVHFATHGILNEVRPQLSGMVLSLYDQEGRYHAEGYFPLNDIYGLDLPVELVVLSACRSGLGKPVRGEGLIGLARGFIHAGAERVLASVWKVDDDATAELMRRFYQKMLKEGKTPAAALSAAQWSMSRETRWSSPYYWAGFILQGEPK
jgi:CHAT domain-containing protein/tetratricopeptide (TPR) repeat protein